MLFIQYIFYMLRKSCQSLQPIKVSLLFCSWTTSCHLVFFFCFFQFEQGVLDACIYILDACHMPISERGNVVKVIRQGSSIVSEEKLLKMS